MGYLKTIIFSLRKLPSFYFKQIVQSYSRVKSCSGSHKLCSSYSIIDEASTSQNITVIIFCNERTSFPPVSFVGDVIRCHRVKCQKFNQQDQLVGWADSLPKSQFHSSSFLIISKAQNDLSSIALPPDDMSNLHTD